MRPDGPIDKPPIPSLADHGHLRASQLHRSPLIQTFPRLTPPRAARTPSENQRCQLSRSGANPGRF